MYLLVSILSCGILIPTYLWLSESQTQNLDIAWNFSRLDLVSLANAINDKSVIRLVILMTLLYTVVAYYFLYLISSKMSKFEFYSANNYIDRFVARHSVVITGVNPHIGTEEASQNVKKVFKKRFGKEKVVSCNTYRRDAYTV